MYAPRGPPVKSSQVKRLRDATPARARARAAAGTPGRHRAAGAGTECLAMFLLLSLLLFAEDHVENMDTSRRSTLHSDDSTADWRGDDELAAATRRLLRCGFEAASRAEVRRSCCEIDELRGEAALAWLDQRKTNGAGYEDDVPRLIRSYGHSYIWRGSWRRPELLRLHGELRLERRRAIEVAQFGPGHAHEASALSAGTISLRDAAAALRRPGGPDQWFDRGVGVRLLQAVADGDEHNFPGLDFLSSLELVDAANESVLSLGRSRTGLPFHSHGESWLSLLRGHKLWLLIPPGPLPPPNGDTDGVWRHTDAFTLSLHDWLHTKLRRRSSGIESNSRAPMVCIQNEGDLMYVPAAWNHATINIGETLALAVQINRLRERVESFSQSSTNMASIPTEVQAAELHVSSGSRQAMLAKIEAADPSSLRGLAMLQDLRDREPGNVDTLTRLVSALIDARSVGHIATTTSKRSKQQKASKTARKKAVKEVHKAIREVGQMLELRARAGVSAGPIVDDWIALHVRCCALLSDLAQYTAAARCLDVAASTSAESAQTNSTTSAQLHYELARAMLRSVEKAMSSGKEVLWSQVQPIAQEVRSTLAIDSQHQGAMELARVLAAPPPNGLGWDDGGDG